MRDASASYWFQVGDRVEVVEDVLKAGVNLRGSCGTVKETWEKCDVDPTCCCAEQVDTGMAVRVAFAATDDHDDDGNGGFLHYFAEDELVKVTETAESADPSSTAERLPFDGMSCVAFKLEQLESSKPRGIASFEPSKPTTTEQKQ